MVKQSSLNGPPRGSKGDEGMAVLRKMGAICAEVSVRHLGR